MYKGYIGTASYDPELSIFHGKIANISDIVTFEATMEDDLEQAFRESVNDYLEFCRQEGDEPEKPWG